MPIFKLRILTFVKGSELQSCDLRITVYTRTTSNALALVSAKRDHSSRVAGEISPVGYASSLRSVDILCDPGMLFPLRPPDAVGEPWRSPRYSRKSLPNLNRMPPFKVNPSSGSHASTVLWPLAPPWCSNNETYLFCRLLSRFSAWTNRPMGPSVISNRIPPMLIWPTACAIGVAIERLFAGMIRLDAMRPCS